MTNAARVQSAVMLFLIGIGLGDEKDITVKGLEAVRSSQRVFLDAYTSVLGVGKESLERFYEIPEIVVADREMVECDAERILERADVENVAFLVVGDPFGATTHADLYLRAVRRGIPVSVVHNASIMNAVGSCGLQLYNYGPAITIPFFTETWQPDSFYHKIEANYHRGLHTLCLLDIKVKEQSEENLLKGRRIYEPARFMTAKQAISQLTAVEARLQKGICTPSTPAVAMMRVGGQTQKILFGTLAELLAVQDDIYGAPLHSLILPARDVHEIEFYMLQQNAITGSPFAHCKFADFTRA